MTMLVSKLIGDKRQWRAYKARTKQLPRQYGEAVEALERYFFVFGPNRGASIQSMLDDLADLFEQSAASGAPVRDVVGSDPVAFAEAFLANYADDGWVAEERRRLADAIRKAES